MIAASQLAGSPGRPPISDPIFVTFPCATERRHLAAQSVVLLGLSDPNVGHPHAGPSVSLTLDPVSSIPLPLPKRKNSGKQALRLDMGDDMRHLKDALLPPASHFLSSTMLNRRRTYLDEAYLHQTLSSWEGKSDLEKALVVANSFSGTPALSFSVNFSVKRQHSLGIDTSKAFRKLRNNLGELSSLGPYLAVLEHDQGGRLHLHGLVSTSSPQGEVKAALRSLGGVSPNVPFRNFYQVKIKPAFHPLCWTHYMLKAFVDIPDFKREGMIFISRQAARMGESHLSRLIDLAEQKLGVDVEWRGRSSAYSGGGTKRYGSATRVIH